MTETDSDTAAVYAECRAAAAAGREISDGCARTIAGMWHDGSSVTLSFVTTGAISSPTDVFRALVSDYGSAAPDDRQALDMLGTYLLAAGSRGPVTGWRDVWVR